MAKEITKQQIEQLKQYTSPEISDLIKSVKINREPRGWEKPSDHTPVILELDN